jgi:hypothetical protein
VIYNYILSYNTNDQIKLNHLFRWAQFISGLDGIDNILGKKLKFSKLIINNEYSFFTSKDFSQKSDF